jgi:hypothetical protein
MATTFPESAFPDLVPRELRFESFLTRFYAIHIPAGETYAFHAGPTFNVDRLPLAWMQIARGTIA